MKKPLMLMILDGFGVSKQKKDNAIKNAKTPCLDNIFENYPVTILDAAGEAVGLPEGQMGNSEVGHTNIGAGRVVYQDLTRITKAIEDRTFFENPQLMSAIENVKQNNSTLHLMGLLSDGGVHSHNTHLYALMQFAKEQGVRDVYIHAFLDGRDVPPKSGKTFVRQCANKITCERVGRIATVMGRYYAMDRDKRYDRLEKAYTAMVLGQGVVCRDPEMAVANSYATGVTDEFVVPAVCDARPKARIKPNDSVIFYNFRPDRAREITRALVDENFDGFERTKGVFPLKYVCMTQYDEEMPNVSVAFPPEELKNTLGEYLSEKGKSQLRIAETEKYAHVTFFFNGGNEKTFENEDRVLIPSPKVATYDMQPYMSAYEVKDSVIEKIKSEKYDVIILNFANCDMVGHTGVFDATIEAVEAVDKCVGEIYEVMKECQGTMIVTADHGNADKMIDDDGEPFTAHTTNPVPFCIINHDCKLKKGKLADIAPTMLDLLGMDKPSEMSGSTLIMQPGEEADVCTVNPMFEEEEEPVEEVIETEKLTPSLVIDTSKPAKAEPEVVEEAPIEEPVAEEPAQEEPEVVEEAPVEEPVAEEPAQEEPEVVEEAPAEEPVAEEPTQEEPEVVEEALAEEPVSEEPTQEEPEVVEEAPAEESVAEELAQEEPEVVEEAPAEEPVAEEPTQVEPEVVEEAPAEESVAEEPTQVEPEVVEEAPVEEPPAEEPVEEEPEVVEEDSDNEPSEKSKKNGKKKKK